MSDEQPRHFYEKRDALMVPGPLVAGPWDARLQGGVPLAGLFAHLIEQVPSLVPMVTTRLLIDLTRPTPMVPFTTDVRIVREGKRVQMIEVDLIIDGVVTAKASAMRVRVAGTPAEPETRAEIPPPNANKLMTDRSRIAHLVERRLIDGGIQKRGPGTAWIRISGEIVKGEPITPYVQAAMCADFGSGLSAVVDWREWSFANVDITLHLTRMPKAGWLKLNAATITGGAGVAVVHGAMFDEYGAIGHTHQTLYLDKVRA